MHEEEQWSATLIVDVNWDVNRRILTVDQFSVERIVLEIWSNRQVGRLAMQRLHVLQIRMNATVTSRHIQ